MVIVVLLIALRGDIKRRYKKLGILYLEWEGWRPLDVVVIILVTLELVVSEDFMTFLNQLKVI